MVKSKIIDTSILPLSVLAAAAAARLEAGQRKRERRRRKWELWQKIKFIKKCSAMTTTKHYANGMANKKKIL